MSEADEFRHDADVWYTAMEDYYYRSSQGHAFEHIGHYYFELSGAAELIADELSVRTA